jgi:hypothetical protein
VKGPVRGPVKFEPLRIVDENNRINLKYSKGVIDYLGETIPQRGRSATLGDR